MKLISYSQGNRIATGLWIDGEVLDIAAAAQLAGMSLDASSVLALIRGGAASLHALRDLQRRAKSMKNVLISGNSVQLLAPLPALARNAFCVGRNYVDHVKEGAAVSGTAVKLPEVPQFFTKATHALNSPNGDIRYDTNVTKVLDYEAELGVIIGAGGRDIPHDKALSHVFGYCVANDFTARDLQRRHDQWFKGKSLDTTLPLGPWIIDSEEIGDPTTLELTLTVNGEERQRARVSQMIFDLPTIISSLSAGLTLEPGDVIATGTPSGVGFAMKPPRPLQDGDLVVTRIDRIGELRNRIVKVK
jgi:2-keto-4-pentenoate hydratase/2-oxohepta-3-ene-1,7-dioic acid hydratase in catechol pathway